jgi:hypothetical protein
VREENFGVAKGDELGGFGDSRAERHRSRQ